MTCRFDAPAHVNGGCIFDAPSATSSARPDGGGKASKYIVPPSPRKRLRDEDYVELALAAVIAIEAMDDR